MVVNAPTSNIVSAAELAVGLLLASARHIAPASQALKDGAWKRSKYTGVELADKVVGVVGLGRIGQLVAQRLSAFGVSLIAYDPYVQPARAAQMNIAMVGLDELLRRSDFITVHLPKTPETVGLIGADALHKVKPSVRIINAARGGIVDEQALAEALAEGRVAGAGLDVFATEPCTDSPLFAFEQVVVTPHLGASTDEAQEKAGIAVARSVRLALAGELVPDAVNVQGGVIADDVRPGLPLTEKLGRIFTALAGGCPASITVEVRGEIAQLDVSVLELVRPEGCLHRRRRRAGVLRQRAAPGQGAWGRRRPGRPTRRAPTTATWSPCGARCRPASRCRSAAPWSGAARSRRSSRSTATASTCPMAEHLAFLRYDDRPGVVGWSGADPGRRRGQHRGHAGRARHPRRPCPGRPDGRLRDPARGPRGDRGRDRCAGRPLGRPARLGGRVDGDI